MADDIFLSPEEQDERARKWLKDNGPALGIGIALGIAGIFGWEQYKDSQQAAAESASTLYQQVLEEFADSELSDFDSQISELKTSHTKTSYAAKAALIKARQLASTDLDGAYNELQWVVDNASESGLTHTARIRQAKIKLSQDDLDAAERLAVHQPQQGFTSYYAELLGEIASRRGDYGSAREQFQISIDALSSSQAAYARVLSLKLDRLPVSGDLEQTIEPKLEQTNSDESASESSVQPSSAADDAATDG